MVGFCPGFLKDIVPGRLENVEGRYVLLLESFFGVKNGPWWLLEGCQLIVLGERAIKSRVAPYYRT
jgi:hypothetical protein